EPRIQQVEQDQAHRHRVRYERLARLAALLAVRTRGEIEACRLAVAVHAGRPLVECGEQGRAQLGMHSAAETFRHDTCTPFTRSCTRVSPIHSLRQGTNASRHRPAADTDSVWLPSPKPIASAPPLPSRIESRRCRPLATALTWWTEASPQVNTGSG